MRYARRSSAAPPRQWRQWTPRCRRRSRSASSARRRPFSATAAARTSATRRGRFSFAASACSRAFSPTRVGKRAANFRCARLRRRSPECGLSRIATRVSCSRSSAQWRTVLLAALTSVASFSSTAGARWCLVLVLPAAPASACLSVFLSIVTVVHATIHPPPFFSRAPQVGRLHRARDSDLVQ